MDNIIVSVVIPCYNYDRYIKESIDSVKKQTFDKWECIIINDGSTDESENVILNEIKDDKRFHYYFQENNGQSSARNNAIKKSKGKYIVNLDADDILDKDYLKKSTEYMEKNDNCALFYGRAYFINDKGEKFLWKLPKLTRYEQLLYCNFIYSTAMYRRKDFDKINGYDESLRAYEDWDFYLRLLNNNFIIHNDENVDVFYYRKHGESIDSNANKDMDIFRMIILKKNYNIIKKYLKLNDTANKTQ